MMDNFPVEGGRWGTVAASVMRRPGLSIAAKATYAALATYADRLGWIWARQSTIAADLERSRTWVLAALAELEAAGMLLHERQFIQGRQRASRYRLLDGIKRFASTNNESNLDTSANDSPQDLADLPHPLSDITDSGVSRHHTNHHDKDSRLSLSGGREKEPNQKHVHQEKEDQLKPEPVTADWVPTAADVSWAKARHPHLDVLAFTEQFVLSCRAKGYRYVDPSAGWRRWLLEPKGRLPLIPSPALPRTSANRTADQDTRHDRSANYHDHHRHSVAARSVASASLAERNANVAAVALERIMARRAGNPPAEPAG
jgi:hypothetical protein